MDLEIFLRRYIVAEASFQAPWFYRNAMSEVMDSIEGGYDVCWDDLRKAQRPLGHERTAQ